MPKETEEVKTLLTQTDWATNNHGRACMEKLIEGFIEPKLAELEAELTKKAKKAQKTGGK